MIARLTAITAWLSVGHAVLLGLFWLLLSVPESNLVMLLASALAVVALAVGFGIVEGGGLAAWDDALAGVPIARRSWRALPGAWIGGLLFVLAWQATASGSAWWQGHRGEIDAWLMAEAGWADTARLHDVAAWVFTFLWSVLGLSLALSIASTVVRQGIRFAARPAWIVEALSPRRLLILAGILLLFVWLPWKAVNWRPAWLAPNWQETAFVTLKLGALFLAANLGWSLVLGTTRGAPRDRA
jgi:hypothetical protein